MTAATSESSASPTKIDVSELPSFAFGSRSSMFWGTVCLCLIEGTALAMLFASYFYLRGNFEEWPPSNRIPPIAGSISTLVLVASIAPFWMARRAARTLDLKRTRRWHLIATIVAVIAISLRAFEISSLPFKWTENAYASVVWASIGLHTLDFLVEVGEVIMLTALLYKGPVEEKHFEDIEVNALFWGFLVLVWLPFAGVFYIDGAIR
jgi:cytochrome c oxidase subunit III